MRETSWRMRITWFSTRDEASCYRHGGLYERENFNSFGAPIVYEDRVEFPDSDSQRRVVVTKSTGAMVIRSGASS
jgi:hypothetical protein